MVFTSSWSRVTRLNTRSFMYHRRFSSWVCVGRRRKYIQSEGALGLLDSIWDLWLFLCWQLLDIWLRVVEWCRVIRSQSIAAHWVRNCVCNNKNMTHVYPCASHLTYTSQLSSSQVIITHSLYPRYVHQQRQILFEVSHNKPLSVCQTLPTHQSSGLQYHFSSLIYIQR